MKKIIGVMGPGAKQATDDDLKLAYEIGKFIAESGCLLLCGGMTGVMETSAQGAREANGSVLGIGPSLDKADMNPHVDIPIVTGLHSGRNFQNVLSSDVLVFISVGSAGTLSELAYAIQMERPSVVIMGSDALKAFTNELDAPKLQFAESIEALKEKVAELL